MRHLLIAFIALPALMIPIAPVMAGHNVLGSNGSRTADPIPPRTFAQHRPRIYHRVAPHSYPQPYRMGYAPPLDYRLDDYRDEHLTYDSHLGDYDGRWVGTWYGADGRVYSGEYEGSFQGDVRGHDLAESGHRHQHHGPSYSYYGAIPGYGAPIFYPGGGYIANGFYYPPPVVTTTVIEYRRVD